MMAVFAATIVGGSTNFGLGKASAAEAPTKRRAPEPVA